MMDINIPSNYPLARFLNNDDVSDSAIIGHSNGKYVDIDSSVCCLPGSLIPNAGRKLITGEETHQQIEKAQVVIRSILKGEMDRNPSYQIQDSKYKIGHPNSDLVNSQLKKFDDLCQARPYLTKGELKAFFAEHQVTVDKPKNHYLTKATEETPLLITGDRESSGGGGHYRAGYGAIKSQSSSSQRSKAQGNNLNASKSQAAGKGNLGIAKENHQRLTSIEGNAENLENQGNEFAQMARKLKEQQQQENCSIS